MAQYFWKAFPGLGGDPWILLDGRLGAAGGPAQHPTQLNTYHPVGPPDGRYFWPSRTAFNATTGNLQQPPWHVAGVDYAVGPRITSFADPAPGFVSNASGGSTTGMAAGIIALGATWDGFNNMVFSGVNNITIQGWDFSLHGGLRCDCNANNITFQDNNCKVGTLAKPFVVGNGSNLLIQYNLLDGNTTKNTDQAGGLLQLTNAGTQTVKYNWLKNCWAQHIAAGPALQPSTSTFIAQFNLFENAGMGFAVDGTHGDVIILASSISGTPELLFADIEISFNTVLQTNTGADCGNGFSCLSADGNVCQMGYCNVGWNTQITLTGCHVGFMNVINTSRVQFTYPVLINSGSLHDNYVDNSDCVAGFIGDLNNNLPDNLATSKVADHGNILLNDGTTWT